MRPEAIAHRVLSITRARAKMHEFRVNPEDYIELWRNPSILFSLAIGMLGDVAATIADNTAVEVEIAPSADDEEDDPQDALRFASIFFDAYIEAELDAELSPELSLLCAAAYYIAGNVGSAVVVARHTDASGSEIAGGLGFLLHAILNDKFETAAEYPHQTHITTVLDALNLFFRVEAEQDVVVQACEGMRKYFYASGSPRELLYADVIGAICTLKLRNASRTILPLASGLDTDQWRPALAKPHFPIELWPAQKRIANAGVLDGKSALIQMPTSAGKTRATELIIRSAFLSQRAHLAVIVAPYRSLCHDIRSDLVIAFSDDNIRLDEATDSYQIDLKLNDLLTMDSVLIVTPEKLLYMLRHAPELANSIGLVIYDEGHQFDGITRGPTYELLLTSLRMVLPAEVQIILISAVIGNASAIAAWLINDADAVIRGEGLLPTRKSIAFASWKDQRGRLEYVKPEDPAEQEFFVPRIIVDRGLRLIGRERKPRRFPENKGGDIGLFLGLHIVRNGSVAVFCGRKDSVTKICQRAVDLENRGVEIEWPVAVSDPVEVEKISSLTEYHLGASSPAANSARLGIFAHHADTPHGIRLAIEHAMKEGLATFVICTSTLAQGVNFPLKYLIVTSTWQGGEQILVRDFQNLMGRAGRAGMHTEGSVIFSTPAIYDKQREGSGRLAWQNATELLDASKSEPSRSSILALFDDYEQRRTPETPPIVQHILLEWSDLAFADASKIEEIVAAANKIEPRINADYFRRFIEDRARVVQSIAAFLVSDVTFDEGADAAERAGELVTHTLAYHLADDEMRWRLLEVFRSIGASIAANTDGNLRTLIRRSPLPPVAVAELQEWLTGNMAGLQMAMAEGRLFEEIAPTLLRFASSRVISRISVQEVIPHLLKDWIAGQPYAAIFSALEKVEARSGSRWVTVEDAVALCENGFGYGVAMVAASVADLSEGMDEEFHSAVVLLQRQIKNGLSSQSALAFCEAGFADRHVSTILGANWTDVSDRAGVQAACRQRESIQPILSELPSYFTTVAAELGRWT